MKKEENNQKFLQSYVYGRGGNFFVSTIYRRSSAMLNPDGMYYETFAWEIDENNQRKVHIIADNSGAVAEKGALDQHYEVVRQLEGKGTFTDADPS